MLIHAAELTDLSGIRHAFFTREGGVSGGIYASLNGGVGSADDPDHVRRNRAAMADAIGVVETGFLSLHQIHSPAVVTVSGPWPAGARPKADAMVSATPGLALAVAHADCGPILFADARAGVIGAAHAGWKGALTGVIEATVAAMEALGAARADIVAVLGPTIGPDAYEVGADYRERFLHVDPDTARHFRPSGRPAHFLFDLPGFIDTRLAGAGIGRPANLRLCTYADERRFFSYRRATHRGEPDYGRMLSAIALS